MALGGLPARRPSRAQASLERALELHEGPKVYLGARHKEQVARRGKKVLMPAKYLAHAALCAVAQDSLSDSLGGGNETGTPQRGTAFSKGPGTRL